MIKIPDEMYTTLNNIPMGEISVLEALYAIKNGTPLPKGHGKIVDIGKIDEDRIDRDNPIIYLTMNGEYIEAVNLDYLNSLPVIIKAEE